MPSLILPCMDKFDVCGPAGIISPNGYRFQKTKPSGWDLAAAGLKKVSSGKHDWFIKVLGGGDGNNYIMIGVAPVNVNLASTLHEKCLTWVLSLSNDT